MKKLRYTSVVFDLKAQYENLVYEDGQLFNGEELIEPEADKYINDHYDDFELTRLGSGNNPENEYYEKVNGNEYVEIHFYGDYEEAFNQI